MNDVTKKNILDIVYKYEDVIIIDVLNHLHRFMWVYNELQVNVDGMNILTGHLYGFMNLIGFLKNKFPKCSIILALDGYDEERREINSSYKGNRESSEVNMSVGVQEVELLCSVFDGVYKVFDKKYEADDAMFSVSKKLESLCIKNGVKKNIYLLTNDKDLLQCAGGYITVIRKFGKGSGWFDDADKVNSYEDIQRFFPGVSAKNIAIYRAIIGDASDNLKGYYRFMKKNAAYISENVDVCDICLLEKESFDEKYKKFLNIINQDYKIFKNNYDIMSLKDFDFEILGVGGSLYKALEMAVNYKMKSFISNALTLSPYREDVRDILKGLGAL